MQDKWQLFQKFLITQNAEISVPDFLINSAIVVVLSLILQWTYFKCGKSLSNRRSFASNFILVAFTTMLIISIVKSSLALSLGLVGALSIVRFRAAIKDPEELSYLFFAISVGLGLGANQRIIVLVAFVILEAILWSRYFLTRKSDKQNLFFTISSNSPGSIRLSDIMNVVKNNFGAAELKRFDETKDMIEASFLIESSRPGNLQSCKEQLNNLSDDVKVMFIDNKGY
ncbi:MAG: DUF4956 domain-containing protein [Bacteroidales bacterium]|nr:DUF4956 domain-containing protein [Bacteroidales bacterium]